MNKRKYIAFICTFLHLAVANAQWGVPPTGWNDFYIGLTDDATKLPIITTAKAVPTVLDYRIRYVNEGVDTLTNWYHHIPSGGLVTNFINQCTAINMKPAFNIYMLQEDAGADVAIANMNNLDFMRRYFWNIRNVAQKANGKKAVFIIEPDTWGYLVKKCYGNGPTSAGGNAAIRPNLVFCNVNNLGYAHLAGLPNTMSGMAQGIIRTIRTFAPDAYVGFHTNHWACWSNGATGAPCLGGNAGGFYQCQAGLPFWNISDIDVNVNFQIAWYNELLGGSSVCDKGDFLAVEKYGYDEGGRWIAFGGTANVLYYGNTQYQNWLYWCKKFAQGINTPLLGWQIPIGNMSLPNTVGTNKYKDGFMEYYFSHKQDFTCAGFIGLFMGPGVGASTYYTNGPGATGDDGWFFSNLRTQLDPVRPVNMNLASIPACAATITTCGFLPLQWLSFTGERKSGMDYLTWSTTQEVDNDHFEIEKSEDGIHFSETGTLHAASVSLPVNLYSWNIQAHGTVYYRIKQVDTDGSFLYSRTIVISEGNTATLTSELFPNPATENSELYLLTAADVTHTVQIFDMSGKQVLLHEFTPDQNFYRLELTLSAYAPGVYYILSTRLSDGSNSRQRLVVQ